MPVPTRYRPTAQHSVADAQVVLAISSPVMLPTASGEATIAHPLASALIGTSTSTRRPRSQSNER